MQDVMWILYVMVIFFFLMIRRPPRSTLFPSTTHFRSVLGWLLHVPLLTAMLALRALGDAARAVRRAPDANDLGRAREDRKRTRPNSSHANISYAVFCLKKKKPLCTHPPNTHPPTTDLS